jgi:hypothetical protein
MLRGSTYDNSFDFRAHLRELNRELLFDRVMLTNVTPVDGRQRDYPSEAASG